MSIETRKEILDGVKGVVWIALVVAGFLAVDKLNTIDKKLDKLDYIETRLIRVEYELKLK
jgi:hypothetical protein